MVITMKTPISLLIDDPAPVVSVYYAHSAAPKTRDGRDLIKFVPDEFLPMFCDVIECRGIRGKFSVVPMPGNYGDIVNGIDGVPREKLDAWLDMLKARIMPLFSIGPEMLTHHKAVDLATGKARSMNERDWASTQDRTTLTPYITAALTLLRDAGIDSCGVTSPWDFGIEVEEEYVASISKAVYDVYKKKNAWYFLRSLRNTPNAKPWAALDEDDRCVVSIPATTSDHFWQTINTDDTSDEFVSRVADELITADGSAGEMVQVLETGGYPILLTHWQSLVSNGLFTGLRALDEVARRINEYYADRVEWMSAEELMKLVVNAKASFPKPDFK